MAQPIIGGRIEDVLASLSELPQLLKKLNDAITALSQAQSRLPTQVSARPSTAISPAPLLDVYTVAFNGHDFYKAKNPLTPLAHTEDLRHYCDAIIVQGTQDYQVEYDRNVTDQTPVTPALEYQNFGLRVSKFISYKVSPAVVAQLGQNISYDFYIFEFWRE